MHYYQPGDVVLGEYRIEAFIGRGGFGEVYRTQSIHSSNLFALKILRRNDLAESEYIQAEKGFQLEAKLGFKLKHSALLRAIRFAPDPQNGQLILVMEYAPGGSLADRLNTQRCQSVPDTIRIASEVASGLAALHDADVVHRDIKPSNILFDAFGKACIGDLGVAQVSTGELTLISQPGTEFNRTGPGTGPYMSPEQERGDIHLRPCSDIYALGLIMFEMLTGRSYKQIRPGTDIRFLRPDVPQALVDLIARMLSDEPERRPWDGNETLHALNTVSTSINPLGEQSNQNHISTETLPRQTVAFQNNNAAQLGAARENLVAPSNSAASASEFMTQTKVKNYWIWAAAGVLLAVVCLISIIPIIDKIIEGWWPTPTDIPTEVHTEVIPTDVVATKTIKLPDCTRVGQTWSSPIDGMQLVCVPAGDFLMGSDDPETSEDEKPKHTVVLDAYWIDKTEVTNAQYTQCVSDGDCEPPGSNASDTRSNYYRDDRYANYPVINVSWSNARDYCAWAGRQLPTEAQWEKAARGNDGRIYPWGDSTPNQNNANFESSTIEDTAAVGSYPDGASPYGAMDMAGNVWEWINDWYDENYYLFQTQWINPTGPDFGDQRIQRGGSWANPGSGINTTFRYPLSPNKSYTTTGFRCALPAAP